MRQSEPRDLHVSLAFFAVVAAAVTMALVSARDLAGGWNDGSRLATVEALVDYHTLAIDESIFVKIPWPAATRPPDYEHVPWLNDAGPRDPFPYPLDYPGAWIGDFHHPETMGTRDKVLVGGHYYSHKPPVPALLLAPWYFVLQRLIGLKAHERCDEFCYWMTLGSAGTSYVVALVCTFQLGGVLRLPLAWRLSLAASMGFCTVTVAYVRHVNDHILLLAVACGLALALTHLGRRADRTSTGLLALIGFLAGLAYTIDQATGPALLLATAALVAYRAPPRRWKALVVFALAALPWLALHHAINYWIGGTFAPIGSVPAFFDWPGSSFDRSNMTGFWNHKSPADFAIYVLQLLIAPWHGFLPHNLPLLLTLPGAVVLWRCRPGEWPELLWGAAWCLAAGFLYAALSSNYGGDCCSIRWFVPFLAVGYYFLALLLRDDHRYRSGFLLFSALGVVLAYFEWRQGPWLEVDDLWFRVVELVAILLWPAWTVWARWKGRTQDARGTTSSGP
jgi:hypothetical protein